MKFIRNFFNAWVEAYYEIDNWFFVKKLIRKHQGTADWDRFQLRADWVGRIYTVLNPQLPGDKGDSKEILSVKYAERLKPINLYLDSIGLSQSITAAWEEIPETDSYLIVYSPIFNVITVWRVFLFSLSLFLFFITKLDTYTWNGLTWLWNLCF